MSAPVCRTAEEAYQAGIRDATASILATPELAARVAALLEPWLKALAEAQGSPRLITMSHAAKQLGISVTKVYELMYRGDLPSVQIPSKTGKKSTRRFEQEAIDAFIEEHRVDYPTTRGSLPSFRGRP